jgi:2-polyprenyl-6-methoxyphenol hydroxylase-like FAD-dependent oxidoreductase
VRHVLAFTGQSLAGPPEAVSLLTLSERAEDLLVQLGESVRNVPAEKRRSAAGRSQALAIELGRGRVVVLGEAAMLSAQIAGGRTRMGFNVPGTDDRQFALNVVRWLTRVL